MRNTTYILIILIFASFIRVDAQRWKRTRYELLYGAGTINAFTDLGGANTAGSHLFWDFDLKGTRPTIYLGARYKIRELVAVRLNILTGWLKASDTYTDYDPRQNRNVIYSGPLFEQSVVGEYSVQKERFGTRYTFTNISRFNIRYLNVFVYAGIGGVWVPSNPNKVYWTNTPRNYHRYNLVFPMGIGLKYGINRRLAFSMDIGHRYTTTDYLEGFSDFHGTGGDSYFLITFNFAYKLRTARSGLPKF